MDVKVKVTIKQRNFFALYFGAKLGQLRKWAKNKFHGFFYRWNMFFMGTNKATSDVIAWDIFTLAAFILMIAIAAVSFI